MRAVSIHKTAALSETLFFGVIKWVSMPTNMHCRAAITSRSRILPYKAAIAVLWPWKRKIAAQASAILTSPTRPKRQVWMSTMLSVTGHYNLVPFVSIWVTITTLQPPTWQVKLVSSRSVWISVPMSLTWPRHSPFIPKLPAISYMWPKLALAHKTARLGATPPLICNMRWMWLRVTTRRQPCGWPPVPILPTIVSLCSLMWPYMVVLLAMNRTNMTCRSVILQPKPQSWTVAMHTACSTRAVFSRLLILSNI